MFANQLYTSLYRLHEPVANLYRLHESVAEKMVGQWYRYYTAKMRDVSEPFDDLDIDLSIEIESLTRLHVSGGVMI